MGQPEAHVVSAAAAVRDEHGTAAARVMAASIPPAEVWKQPAAGLQLGRGRGGFRSDIWRGCGASVY